MARETNNENQETTTIAAFRLPQDLKQQADEKCTAEDINFSQLMRRAVRKELGIELEPTGTTNT
jgi:hypothetical protein